MSLRLIFRLNHVQYINKRRDLANEMYLLIYYHFRFTEFVNFAYALAKEFPDSMFSVFMMNTILIDTDKKKMFSYVA